MLRMIRILLSQTEIKLDSFSFVIAIGFRIILLAEIAKVYFSH